MVGGYWLTTDIIIIVCQEGLVITGYISTKAVNKSS